MRKWVVAALLLFAAAALVWVIFFHAQAQAQAWPDNAVEIPSARPSIGIYSASLADRGNGSGVLLRAFLYPPREGATAEAFCESRLQRNLLLLNHTAAPGVGQGLAERIRSILAASGRPPLVVGAKEAAGYPDSVVIAAGGALPAEFAGREGEFAAMNNRLVLVDSLPGRSISQDGRISPHNESAWFETVALTPGGEESAALRAARAALVPEKAVLEGVQMGSGNATVVIWTEGNFSQCRMVYCAGQCIAADSEPLRHPAGRLIGPWKAAAGSKAVFEFSPDSKAELGRSLRFYLLLQKDGREVARREIAGGKVSEGWTSRIPVEFGSGGNYLVAVADQFGRQHAAAIVRVEGLEIIPRETGGNRYEFSVLYGGEPASGLVLAWIDNGSSRSYLAANGTLLVWAAPSAGKHAMHLSYRNQTADYPFEAQGSDVFGAYLRLGVPALAFLAAVFLLAGAKRKAKYSITFPEVAQGQTVEAAIGKKELLRAYKAADALLGGHGLPVSLEELSEELGKLLGNGEARIEPHSLLRALKELEDNGTFAEWDGAFIPSAAMGGFSAEQCSMLRLLHDVMLERGIPFEKRQMNRIAGSDYEMMVYGEKTCVSSGLGKRKRIVIFPDQGAIMRLERSLDGTGRKNVEAKLARLNGKLVFVVARRSELEAVLP